MMNRIYICGPMTGLPNDNVPAFHKAAARLRVMNCGQVVNPVEVCARVEPHTWVNCMRTDLKELVDCNVMVLLPGWDNSRGAQLELAVAKALGIWVFELERFINIWTKP